MNRWIAMTVILFSVTIQNSIGQTHVQTATLFQTTTATTIAKTFAASSTSGNLIVVHLDWDNQSRSINTVTDNKGNTYARINGPTNWNGASYRAELWYAYNITGGGGAITVTAQLSGAPTSFSQIYISEYSGIATISPLDQNSVAIGNSAAVNSGAKTTTAANELVYGASIGASGTLTTGAGFTNRSTANSNIIEDKNAASAGSYSAGFTSASGNWIAQMATFRSTNISLPVDLLSLTGYCNNKNTVLEWTTASENNNDYFSIERSENGNDWKNIGTVKSIGNSSVAHTYSFIADETNNEISYFRLKQTDLDGKFNYFKIIKVNNCNKEVPAINIYPNPSNGISLFGKINLKSNEKYSVEIFDNSGKMVSQFTSTQSEFTINFPHVLPQGVYYAKFSSMNFSKVASFLVKHY
jgi:hypothetical protein